MAPDSDNTTSILKENKRYGSDSSSRQLPQQEPRRIARIRPVREMRRRHNQRPITHHIPQSTINLDLVLWEIRNLPSLLCIARIPKQHNTLDLLLDLLRKPLDGPVHHRRALAVPPRDNLRVGAFRRSLLEQVHGFIDGGRGGVLGECVRRQVSCVGWSDALAGYLAWFGGFEVVADCWAGRNSLLTLVTVAIGGHAGSSYEETWFG